VGREPTRELEAMLGYARAASVPEFREHLREWFCPTFNWVIADRNGEIGYQLTGKLPLRREEKCRYRLGTDPADRWAGYVPFEALPATGEPPEGWLGSANNVVAVDWPYPLSGTWPSDYRMHRLVDALNQSGQLSREALEALQYDALSPRAVEWSEPAVAALRAAGVTDPLLDEIAAWDGRYTLDSRAAVVFECFFVAWARQVLTLRLPPQWLTYLFPASIGLVEQLWRGDPEGWFEDPEARLVALRAAWEEALTWLEGRFGADRESWRWGEAHVLVLRHPLGTSPLLQELFQRGPVSHPGTWNTINNSLYDPSRLFETTSGVSYRLLVDLAGRTEAITPGGQSGHPGSAHYDDQLSLWARGEYHPLELGKTEGEGWVLRGE
jgi:penicillin amidase